MVSKLLVVFCLFTSPAQALLYLNGYGQLSVSSIADTEETISGRQLTHDGQTYGMGAGARIGASFPFVTVGAMGEIQKQQYEGEREDTNVVNAFDGAEDYDNVMTRSLYGAFVLVNPPVIPIHFIAEYYAAINGKMTYAENRGENPFNENDELNGTGFGVGVGFQNLLFDGKIVFRRLSYDEMVLSGVTSELPSSRYEKFDAWELSFQGGIAIDLL